MHLLIPHAAPLSDAGRHALATLQLPRLEALLARWTEAARDDGDETLLSPPHERVLARALGWQAEDGLLPWAAREMGTPQAGGPAAWAWATPTHWAVGTDQVTLLPSEALALADSEARTVFEAVQPLFEGEGARLVWQGPDRWAVAHPSLASLPTASLDRVIHRSVDAWLPRTAGQGAARLWRRLQNEVQMLLHTHALNEAREARGALPVNSFWLSGSGAWQPAHEQQAPQVDARLRAPALSEDWHAWVQAWQALDAGPIAALLDTPGTRLTLCGERSALTLAHARPSLWQRLRPGRRPAAASLETL
ncbi:hypothetical protein V4F39_05840 [Aquincola sp. MAHUQ-54]|uniref:Phosphoglycerate mutase n=1 Tax=Aquincola agrisoli TaxID=3119538 RepID=A0AAW9QDP6_9BURK